MRLTTFDLVLIRTRRNFKRLAAGRDKNAAFGRTTLAHAAYRALRRTDPSVTECYDLAELLHKEAHKALPAVMWPPRDEPPRDRDPEVDRGRWHWWLAQEFERYISTVRLDLINGTTEFERYIPKAA